MDTAPEKIVLVEADSSLRAELQSALEAAGYQVAPYAAAAEALEAIRKSNPDVLLIDASLSEGNLVETLSAIRGTSLTASVRVILLVGSEAKDRETGIEMGANDALSRPWEMSELLARVREQCRERAAEQQLRDRARLAEEGQQIAYTAFDAVAVTEKMTKDAFRLDRRLSVGLGVAFAIVAAMAAMYFLFARKAQQETLRATRIVDKLGGGLVHQQDLIAEARKRRLPGADADSVPPRSEDLKKQGEDIKAKMAAADPATISTLQKQLADTNARLKKVEQEDSAAQGIIQSDAQSVCLLHVSVAFRHQQSGKRLRFAGLNPNGEPLQDSQGHPIFTLDGDGPEVKFDVFGTGFVVGANGLVVTNRHVAEPWWKNNDLDEMTGQGYQAEISAIRAYFPADPRAFHAEIETISNTTDLATMRVDMQDLKRTALSDDASKGAATPGEAVVLMGYAAGLDAILAKADDQTTENILTHSGGQVSRVLDDLAQRGLIRPLITQGHVGDVLPDKIVFDAQTTHGGSGGPLFNGQGKVIGVTFAVLADFGGSNFAIPIRLSQPLLKP
ncbi:MAG TPA: trypsin-like peptidase domain-containing protein [Verrucomicrobiae bacterium]|nr:trypsin-like peptidase domain-containing protein [Verrucomicrobiae bacterium]